MFTYLFEKNNFKCVFIAKVIIGYFSKENGSLLVAEVQYMANAPPCLQKCVILLTDRQVKVFPSTPAGMADVTMTIMQHFSNYMSYCYIVSGINKAPNVISYYIMRKVLINLCIRDFIHYELIITL